MTYDEALTYLYSFTNYEFTKGSVLAAARFDLGRVKHFMSLLGNPQDSFRSVLIAGTKGKGSTASMITGMVQAAGYRVGLYSQPHLHTFRERMQIGGSMISPDRLAGVVERVRPAVGAALERVSDLGPLTTYEIATGVALSYFAEEKVDLAVVEVGLGGRLDAANVVHPLVSVITPISLDHVHFLGDTVEKIAAEKAGIVKERGDVVLAPQVPEAKKVILATAREKGATVYPSDECVRIISAGLLGAGKGYEVRAEFAPGFPPGHRLPAFAGRLPLLGQHQLTNLSVALGTVGLLTGHGLDVPWDAAAAGLAAVRWPGRLEVVSRQPLILLDGAHNGDSARKLRAALREVFQFDNLVLVVGTSADKDMDGIVSELAPAASLVIATRSGHPRSLDAAQIEETARRYGAAAVSVSPVAEAIAHARRVAGPNDLICATGSLFVVAEARESFGLAEAVDSVRS